MLIPFIRTLVLYIFIVIAVRLMGKRQVGEMQPVELVITILISAVASVPMQNLDIPLMHGIVPILTLLGAEIIISLMSLKFPSLRRILTGKPIPIIKDGVIDQKAAKMLRFSADDILEDLRLKDVFDIRSVSYAQMETNGQLSVLLTEKERPVTAGQMSLSPKPSGPFYILISDGFVVPEGLSAINQTEKWLRQAILSNGAQTEKEVFLFCADTHGNVIFAKRGKR